VHFSAPQVLAGESLNVLARFTITPQAIIPIFEQLARQSVSQLTAGRELTFNVPYNLEGTVFANAGSLGRIAAGFGPAAGDWTLPVQRLIAPAVPAFAPAGPSSSGAPPPPPSSGGAPPPPPPPP
jgi:hypothetical protein